MQNQVFYQYYQDEKDDKISQRLFMIFVFILLLFYLALFITNIFFQQSFRYVTINGTSMQPTLNPNPVEVEDGFVQDGVYIKLTQDIDYNDIIIIDKSVDNSEYNQTIIKRVLGFEYDKISIAKVEVDGKSTYRFMRIKSGTNKVEIIYEDYIKSYDLWNAITSITDGGIDYENIFYKTFLMGNNVSLEYVEGVGYVKFYQIQQNQIFYMGDNRTGSSDARSSGTENIEKVIGKVVEISHNSTNIQNSLFWWFNRVVTYLKIIGKQIIEYFAWKV